MLRNLSVALAIVIAVIATPIVRGATQTQTCQLKWSSVDLGGGISSSANYRVLGSIQPRLGRNTLADVLWNLRVPQVEPNENVQGTPDGKPVTALNAVYPNPCPSTDRAQIRYSLASEGRVSVKVFDLSGKLVSSLVEQTQKPGSYNVSFAPQARLARGVYFVKLVTDNSQDAQKLVVR